MDKRLAILLSGVVGIAGGVITALLLSPKSGRENREWIADQTEGTKLWLEEKGKNIREEGEKRIDRISRGVKKTLDENLPDLYKATEKMKFETPEDEA
ncbi:YtxH domain-containing protein [Balneola sp. MJW-20]|uniref:YtxH domain-containing protein n=1 Tax=Gracilimonas aurantiaca TaxID=3234185 RepID=UPI003467867B